MISSISDGSHGSVITRQLGLSPRGKVSVSRLCSFGFPAVIETLPDGDFFTVSAHWLTCPHLKKNISRLENDGGLVEIEKQMKVENFRAEHLKDLEVFHDHLDRVFEMSFSTKIKGIGIDGCRNATRIKCLHAYAARYLAGFVSPVGKWAVARVSNIECANGKCEEYVKD